MFSDVNNIACKDSTFLLSLSLFVFSLGADPKNDFRILDLCNIEIKKYQRPHPETL